MIQTVQLKRMLQLIVIVICAAFLFLQSARSRGLHFTPASGDVAAHSQALLKGR